VNHLRHRRSFKIVVFWDETHCWRAFAEVGTLVALQAFIKQKKSFFR